MLQCRKPVGVLGATTCSSPFALDSTDLQLLPILASFVRDLLHILRKSNRLLPRSARQIQPALQV